MQHNTRPSLIVTACLVCLLWSAAAGAQQAPAPASPLTQLSAGWAHLGERRIDEAIRVGEAVLKSGRETHRALALLVAAEVAAGRPGTALDRYEKWLGVGRPDDLYLLTDIAIGFTRLLAAGTDPIVQAEARAILDRIDGPEPTATAATSGGVLADAALARAGNPEAIARLQERLKSPMGPEAGYVIGALAEAGDLTAVPALRELTASRQPVVQLAAIRALGTLGAKEAIPELRTLASARLPLVATQATVALSQLGDADAIERLTTLLASPQGEERLMVAEAIGVGEWARWSDAVTPILDDPSLMLRVQAALLLSRAGLNVPRAQEVLAQALGSENPILREQAGQAFTAPDQADPLLLRRFLRDRDGRVQLRGIQGFLALTRR